MRSGLRPQQVFTIRRRITPHLIRMFGELTGDVNYRHMNPVRGELPIVHGLHLASMGSMFGQGLDILGRRFSMEFLAPTYAEDDIELTITVTGVRHAGPLGDLVSAELVYRNQHGTTLALGDFTGLAQPGGAVRPARDVETRP